MGLFYLVLFAVAALPALISKRYFTDYFAKKATPEARLGDGHLQGQSIAI